MLKSRLNGSAYDRCELYLADVVAADADARDLLRQAWLAGFDERSRIVDEQQLEPMPDNLTPTQRHVLRAFARAVDRDGVNPTMGELAEAIGVSKVTIFEHFGELVKKGCLRRTGAHKSRCHALAVLVPREREETR